VEYHRKIAMNFALFFLLVGTFPFALKIRQRRAAMSAFALTLSFCFVYYFLFSFCIALGKSDLFPPWIAAWMTNLFFGVSGLVGLASVK
jgi:lipopolysaccharide export system permease protein